MGGVVPRLGVFCAFAAVLSLAIGQTTPPTPLRNASKMRTGSRIFESTRRQDRPPPLRRIRDRVDLEQVVCTAALKDAPVWQDNSPAALMYRTGDLTVASQELIRIAAFQDN